MNKWVNVTEQFNLHSEKIGQHHGTLIVYVLYNEKEGKEKK